LRCVPVNAGAGRSGQQEGRAKTMAQEQAAGKGRVERHKHDLTQDVHRMWLVID
jgi:hypothetical protein